MNLFTNPTFVLAEMGREGFLPIKLMQTHQHYCNRLVQRFYLPPWLFGNRYLPTYHPEDYVKRVHSIGETNATFGIIDPKTVIKNSLPCNIDSPDKLNSQPYGNYPYAFSDIPLLEIEPSWTATIYDCLILRYQDKWKNDESMRNKLRSIKMGDMIKLRGYFRGEMGMPVFNILKILD